MKKIEAKQIAAKQRGHGAHPDSDRSVGLEGAASQGDVYVPVTGYSVTSNQKRDRNQ